MVPAFRSSCLLALDRLLGGDWKLLSWQALGGLLYEDYERVLCCNDGVREAHLPLMSATMSRFELTKQSGV